MKAGFSLHSIKWALQIFEIRFILLLNLYINSSSLLIVSQKNHRINTHHKFFVFNSFKSVKIKKKTLKQNNNSIITLKFSK